MPLNKARSWGQIGWLGSIRSVLMDGNADTVSAQTQEVLGPEYHRFDIALGVTPQDRHAVNDDFDDAASENIVALLAKADDLLEAERTRVNAVAQLLRTPKESLGEAPSTHSKVQHRLSRSLPLHSIKRGQAVSRAVSS
jgi:hypothetical protein